MGKTPYFWLNEGFGATIEINDREIEQDISITLVGTIECKDSVGVYIPIDKNHCFVAHIKVLIESGPQTDRERARRVFRPAEDLRPGELKQIEERIVDKLINHSVGHNWGPFNVKRYVDEHKDIRPTTVSPLVVCSTMSDSLGKCVLRALASFLEVDEATTRTYFLPYMDGFIMDHAAKTPVQPLKGRAGAAQVQAALEPVVPPGAMQEWVFYVQR